MAKRQMADSLHASSSGAGVPTGRSARAAVRPVRIAAASFACVILFALGVLWYIGVFGGNVRTVVPGAFYRSAELTGANLDRVLETDHIKTVINLRGGSPRDSWYRAEVADCRQFGVRHVDIPFSAVRLPPPAAMRDLLHTLDAAAYPVLVHCHGGADRSGLASTLYLALYRGVPLANAQERELTWRFGHIAWGQARAMDDFLALYRSTSRGVSLRQWILRSYPDIYAALPSSEKTPGYDVAASAAAAR